MWACLIMMNIVAMRAGAQTQELQQLKLDLEKLAQFKLMLSEMKSGYQTMLNGYNTLRDLGKNNFSLHKDYLDGLLLVSPSVTSNPVLQRTIAAQQTVVDDAKTWVAGLKKAQVFTAGEISEAIASYTSIGSTVKADVDLLLMITIPGTFRMSDGERMDLISALERSVQKQVLKFDDLQEQYNRLMTLRIQAKKDMQDIRRLGKQ